MGGDGQPQFQAAIFTRYLFGDEPGDAIDRPRWRWGRTWGRDQAVTPASRWRTASTPTCSRRSKAPATSSRCSTQPYSHAMGHAGMIVRRPDGRFLGASDPRSDGAAVGA